MANVKDTLDINDEHHMKDLWMHEVAVYTGDTNLINDQTHKKQHIPSSLGAAVIGINNTCTPTFEITKDDYIWTDIDAQEVYLNTKPTCYLILGKPDVNSFTLGESLSKKYNCIHLCPRNIITDEVAQESLTGRCMEFNMRHNNVCTYASIIEMLKQKIKSPAVRHRGYVISGFPLVTTFRDPNCLIKSHNGEEAIFNAEEVLYDLIYNLKRKKPKPQGPAVSGDTDNIDNMGEEEYNEEEEEEEEEAKKEEEEEEAEEEEVAAELPKFFLNTCSDVFHKLKPYYASSQSLLLHQLHEIFNLDLTPDIILYITCPDADVVTLKHHKYLNYKTGQKTVEPFPIKIESDLRWPTQYTISDYENPHANFVFHPKYNCRSPINFQNEVVSQLCNYRKYVLPYIERKIMDYDPSKVIKLDGRTSTYQMMHQISERLLLMDVNAVLIPEPLYLTEAPEDFEEFWNMVAESQVIRSNGLTFNRYASPWHNRCPVELKKRQSVIGKPKYAVALFKHVYLLSSLANFIAFCRNPRPFLKIRYLEPPCRIIVTGTKSSGKTMTAECLSWIFDTPITRFDNILENERKKKYDVYAKTIYSEIVPVIEDARFTEWQRIEQEREANLKTWNNSNLRELKKYLPLLIQSFRYIEVESSTDELEEEGREEYEGGLREYDTLEQDRIGDVGHEKEKKTYKSQQAIEEEDKQEKEEVGVEQGEEENKIQDEIEGEQELAVEEEEKIVVEAPIAKTVTKKETKKKETRKEKPPREEPDPAFLKKFSKLKERLFFLPILDNVTACETAISNGDLSQYAPPELTKQTVKPSLPVLGDEDVTKAISEYITVNEIQKEIEPTAEEVMNIITKQLSTIDTDRQQETNFQEYYGKYIIDGFPSDPEYWGFLSNAKLIPDYTIAIMENREVDHDLLMYYLSLDTRIKNYLENLISVKDPLILCKLQTKKINIPKGLDIQMIVHDIVYDTINNLVDDDKSKTEDKPEISTEMISAFTESIEKFRENWDSVKIKLEDKSKCFIEVELENKTDVEVLQEVLLKLRQCYFLPSEATEGDEELDEDEGPDVPKDRLTYNNPRHLCETNIYCPYSYFNYGLLWEGKQEFCLKYDNKLHYFAKEEFLELFRKDITKYQAYNNPFKKLPALKICIIGCAGSGLSALSKRIAMEMGLIHIHFADIINYYYMPRHYKNVGRKYENPFTDEPMEEEGVVEFQMDEENPHLLADIFSNEKELRRIVYNYYERGQPILPMIMHKIIKSLWFTEPFNYTGFVLDGYPRLPQDVEDLIHCNCIPDVVIEIESTAEIGIERIGPLMFNQWKSQLKEAKDAHKVVIETQQELWMSLIAKKAVVKLIIEEILENCGQEDPLNPIESFVFDAHPTGSTNVDPKLFQIYNELIEEYPKPKDTREWEKLEDVRERINARIEAICETEYENIQSLKDILVDNKINLISIDGSKPFIKVLKHAISKLKYLRNRNQSFFEQTYIITTDIADLLLSQGYCFLSRFGRMCPVYVRENINNIHNSYKISRRTGKLFPVIHRTYVYFLCSEENVIKFRTNPLKYIIDDNIKTFHPCTLGMAIIGAPKSGKSTLASKLARRNNFICISRGKALRSVLETMSWTELGRNILKKLNDGDIVDTESVMSAVQTVAIDHRTVTYGFILDGFPTTPYEAVLLGQYGLYPNVVFDISAEKTIILANSQKEIHHEILKYLPPYPNPLIENRFTQWNDQSLRLRHWIHSDYQNLCSLDGNKSRWQSVQDVYKHVEELTSDIHAYLTKVDKEVVPVKVMALSNDLFKKKMSQYRDFCPVCLRNHVLKYSGYPVDRKGVMQYKNKFYWICAEHVELVYKFPDYYLYDDLEVPEVPAVVTIINPHNVYENGICIVTYAENLPGQVLERGIHKFAAVYRSHTYLFCSDECLKKFLAKPDFYADIVVFKGCGSYPRLSLKKIPDIGYLEQTLANILTAACCSVNAVRPKYPGLSISISGVLYIALFLKIRNPRLDKDQILFYQKAMKMFENRAKLILDIGLRMRSMENPFVNYPKCRHGTPKPYSPVASPSPGASSRSENFKKNYPSAVVGSSAKSHSGVRPSSVAKYPNEDDDISYSNKYYSSLGSINDV